MNTVPSAFLPVVRTVTIPCVGRDFDIWFDGEQVMESGKFLV